jgi:hypothetical protein
MADSFGDAMRLSFQEWIDRQYPHTMPQGAEAEATLKQYISILERAYNAGYRAGRKSVTP